MCVYIYIYIYVCLGAAVAVGDAVGGAPRLLRELAQGQRLHYYYYYCYH